MPGTTMPSTSKPARRSVRRRRWPLALPLMLALTLALPVAGGAQEPQDDPADRPPEPEDTHPGRGGGPRPDGKACERAAAQSQVHELCAALSSGGAARADYDGDGFTDLAIGVPGRTVSGKRQAGLVYVMYGTQNGLSSSRVQILWQDMSASMGPSGQYHEFGAALAGGDFNGDGVADLAIGVPGQGGHGVVKVINGVRGQGLGSTAQTLLFTFQSRAEQGAALVWGDFNGDGRADLAIGAPGLNLGGHRLVGGVWVVHGAPSGLGTSGGSQFWAQDRLGPASAPLHDVSYFGDALAAGDVGRSAHHDLVIGSSNQPVAGSDHRGAVHVLYGGSQGLSTTGAQRWHFPLTGTSIITGDYGRSLAIGDFSGDGVGDLAIAAPGAVAVVVQRTCFSPCERIVNYDVDGLVHVLRGTRTSGVTRSGERFYRHLGPSPRQQSLGQALAAADLNGDGRADLAIGAPYETIGNQELAGAVYIVHGSSGGLSSQPAQRWRQGVSGLFGSPVARNMFGSSLTAWNWGRGTQGDLAVGVPGQTVSGLANAGVVQVLYGTSSGLSSNGQQYIHEGRLPGAGPESGARFGRAMY